MDILHPLRREQDGDRIAMAQKQKIEQESTNSTIAVVERMDGHHEAQVGFGGEVYEMKIGR